MDFAPTFLILAMRRSMFIRVDEGRPDVLIANSVGDSLAHRFDCEPSNMEQSNEYQLSREIIARSNATTWDEAKLEWDLAAIYHQAEPETCLCGHFPIIEICVLQNRLNGNRAIVGNVCVKKFMGLPSERIFQAVRRIRKDPSRPLNAEAIEHAFQHGWINDWERRFCFDTMRKRKPSQKQLNIRLQINENVLKNVVRKWKDSADV
jgi:hypothetical protein